MVCPGVSINLLMFISVMTSMASSSFSGWRNMSMAAPVVPRRKSPMTSNGAMPMPPRPAGNPISTASRLNTSRIFICRSDSSPAAIIFLKASRISGWTNGRLIDIGVPMSVLSGGKFLRGSAAPTVRGVMTLKPKSEGSLMNASYSSAFMYCASMNWKVLTSLPSPWPGQL